MNRSEYIAQLTAALRGKLAFDEIEDIVRDYQEFFDEGVRQGKSEEQVAAELGNPRDVAQQILSEERETPSSGTASSEGGFRDSFTRGAGKGGRQRRSVCQESQCLYPAQDGGA